MGEISGVEWTKHTFNPWWGCVKVSPGCDHCYAEREAIRYGHQVWGPDSVRRELTANYWQQPYKWDRKAQADGALNPVFCGSHCDVMETGSHLQKIRVERLYPLIEATEHLLWLLVTKRPQHFRTQLPASWIERPRANVRGITTVENAEYLWRARTLIQTPFASRGLSMEPLLGPVTIPDDILRHIDWVIVGGESGTGARPMRVEWARALRDQCVAAGVAFFFKQWGEHGADLVQIGKRQAGRLLDGREWNEGPLCA